MAEVELLCAAYCETRTFIVKITRDAKVRALQEVIVETAKDLDPRFNINPNAVTLYVAKKDRAWLRDDHSVDAILLGEVDKKYERMRQTWALKNPKYFGDFNLEKEAIHVLVEFPEVEYVDPRLLETHEALLRHVLLDSTPTTSTRTQEFEDNLRTTYGCNEGEGMVRCMVLDTALPTQLVIASHLFRRKNAFLSDLFMGISDIDDVKNGLLLFKPLKRAYDHFQIGFIYDRSSDEFRLKLFDRSIRQQRLFDVLDDTDQGLLRQDHSLPEGPATRSTTCTPHDV